MNFFLIQDIRSDLFLAINVYKPNAYFHQTECNVDKYYRNLTNMVNVLINDKV